MSPQTRDRGHRRVYFAFSLTQRDRERLISADSTLPRSMVPRNLYVKYSTIYLNVFAAVYAVEHIHRPGRRAGLVRVRRDITLAEWRHYAVEFSALPQGEVGSGYSQR